MDKNNDQFSDTNEDSLGTSKKISDSRRSNASFTELHEFMSKFPPNPLLPRCVLNQPEPVRSGSGLPIM